MLINRYFMLYNFIKIILSAIIITLVSIISKSSSFWGSIFASIPLISVMAIIWLYTDTKNISNIINLSYGIFWMVLPSLALFIVLPTLLKLKISFWISLIISITATILCYFLMIFILNKLGISSTN